MKKKFKRGNAIYNNFNIIKYRKIEINNSYVIYLFKLIFYLLNKLIL